MADHTPQKSDDVAAAIVVRAVLRALEATPGVPPHLQAYSVEQIAVALAVLSEAGFIEDYVLTPDGRAFLQKLADT